MNRTILKLSIVLSILLLWLSLMLMPTPPCTHSDSCQVPTVTVVYDL